MRSKTMAPAPRVPRTERTTRGSRPKNTLRNWIATAIMIALAPALFAPILTVNANTPSLTADRSQVAAGSSVTLVGRGFDSRSKGNLAFDGITTGPGYRADANGFFTVAFKVPSGTPAGDHTVAAMSFARRSTATVSRLSKARVASAAVLASVVLVVGPAKLPTPSPTSQPSLSPTPTSSPTPTRSPVPTSTPAPPSTPTASATPVATTPPPPSSPAPTASPVAVGGGSSQPSFPMRAAFYYPWFPEAWNQQGLSPFTKYLPSLGYYDGASLTVVQKQVAAMQYGHIAAGIASWWGQGSRTDSRIPTLLAATQGTAFRWALYYEVEGSSNPSVTQIRSDLTYIRDRYGSDPGFLRINGQFVVFVYADGTDQCATADRWRQANTVGAYVVLKVFPGYATCASQPQGWHQYGPAAATSAQGPYSFSISPGFYKANESSPRLVRDLARWTTNIRQMVASGARFQLVTTFNEWGEGTSVESATQWATSSGFGAYLDALHNN